MKKLAKPKKLYRFDRHDLIKHKVTEKCNPQIEINIDEFWAKDVRNHYGVLYRCTSCGEDFAGFSLQKEAKKEAVDVAIKTISEEQQWLTKLSGESL